MNFGNCLINDIAGYLSLAMEINKLRILLVKKIAAWCGIDIFFEQILKVVEVKKMVIDRTDLDMIKIERTFVPDPDSYLRAADYRKEFCHIAGDKFAEWLKSNPEAIRVYQIDDPLRYEKQTTFVANLWLPIPSRRYAIDWKTDADRRWPFEVHQNGNTILDPPTFIGESQFLKK